MIAKEIIQGRKRVHFQRIRAEMNLWEGRKHGFRVELMDFFFFSLLCGFRGGKGKRERVGGILQLMLQLLVSWTVLAFLSSLFKIRFSFFLFFFYRVVSLKSEMYK